MRVIEQFLEGKHSQDECEDGIVVTDNYIAVIDGSTSKTVKRLNGNMSNGQYCMRLIADFVRSISKDCNLEEFCEGITSTINKLYSNNITLYEEHPEERLCASAVIYSHTFNEIWMIGDCQCMVDGILYENPKDYEADIANQRATIFLQEESDHLDMTQNGNIIHDYARDKVIGRLVNAMREGENKTYAVIDGFPIYKEGIKTIRLNNNPHEIVLASDGYPFLKGSLRKSEQKLKQQLSNDPYNIKTFKATKGLMAGNKSFDDRAYIRFSTAGSQRYFINISFDGTAYHGWQIQPNGMSVQQRLQDCLSRILRQGIDVVGAGRTDAGVHAKMMICHFDNDKGIDCVQLAYRLNQILPQDISCEKIYPVDNNIHARFSAKKRTYRYFIRTKKSPFHRNYSVETHYVLDFPLMNKAAECLLEVSDFKAFCKAGADNKTTICHVSAARWVQTSEHSWYFEISADRFLRNMVRAIVGTIFDVGRHRITIEQFRQIVYKGTRQESGESMPAKGLFLWNIEY